MMFRMKDKSLKAAEFIIKKFTYLMFFKMEATTTVRFFFKYMKLAFIQTISDGSRVLLFCVMLGMIGIHCV